LWFNLADANSPGLNCGGNNDTRAVLVAQVDLGAELGRVLVHPWLGEQSGSLPHLYQAPPRWSIRGQPKSSCIRIYQPDTHPHLYSYSGFHHTEAPLLLGQYLTVAFQPTFWVSLDFPRLKLLYVPLSFSFHLLILVALNARFFNRIGAYAVFVPWTVVATFLLGLLASAAAAGHQRLDRNIHRCSSGTASSIQALGPRRPNEHLRHRQAVPPPGRHR